jgi:hypothetical protein
MTFEILSEKDIRSYLIFTLGVFRAFEPIDDLMQFLLYKFTIENHSVELFNCFT